MYYNFPLAIGPANDRPPSRTTTPPTTCAPALLHKYTTDAAMSSGVPNLPLGVDSPSFSEPPPISIKPCAILEGNIPGAMQFTRMFLGPSSKARFRARWITAALDVTYEWA